jgi:hypothetical protein
VGVVNYGVALLDDPPEQLGVGPCPLPRDAEARLDSIAFERVEHLVGAAGIGPRVEGQSHDLARGLELSYGHRLSLRAI